MRTAAHHVTSPHEIFALILSRIDQCNSDTKTAIREMRRDVQIGNDQLADRLSAQERTLDELTKVVHGQLLNGSILNLNESDPRSVSSFTSTSTAGHFEPFDDEDLKWSRPLSEEQLDTIGNSQYFIGELADLNLPCVAIVRYVL